MKEQSLVSKLFWSIMPIQMLMCSLGAINSLIDGIIGSRFIGSDAMAAVGLFGPVSTVIGGITSVLCVGATIKVTYYLGKTDSDLASRIFSFITIIVTLFTVLCSVILVLFAKPLASLLSGDMDNTMLSDYIVGISIFLVFQMLSSYLIGGLQIICRPKRAYAAIAIMGISNAVLDIFMVCVFRMGIFGLGMATGISYALQTLFILPSFMGKKSTLRIQKCLISGGELLDIVRDGLPSALGSVSMSLKGFILNGVLLNVGGLMAVAAASAQNTYCWFLGSVTTGISQAVLLLMSLYVSEEDRDSIEELFHICVKWAFILGFSVAIIMFTFAKPFAAIFYENDPEALGLTTLAIRLFPWFLPFNILIFSFVRMYQAQDKTAITYVFSFAENLVVAVCTVVLANMFGTNGVFAALPVSDMLLLAIMLITVWCVRKRVTLNPFDIMLLDRDFGVSKENRLSKTIYSLEEGINISEEVICFCEGQQIEHRISKITGLCVEEITILLFKYGFAGVKRPQADIRLIKKGDVLTIRLRNNGNPIFKGEKIETFDSDDPTANVGINLLLRLTEDVICNSILGLNVITIKLKVQTP